LTQAILFLAQSCKDESSFFALMELATSFRGTKVIATVSVMQSLGEKLELKHGSPEDILDA
jgi:hypothetical protein